MWKVSKCGVFSGPYFPAFGLNTKIYVSLRIQSECGEIRTRETPHLYTFHAVNVCVDVEGTYILFYKIFQELAKIFEITGKFF